MLSARSSLMNSFERNKDYIAKHNASMTPAELEARLSLIESNYSQCCAIQAKIELESDDASEYDGRQAMEELYCEIKAKILSSLGHARRRSSTIDVLNSTQVSRQSKLPKLIVPEFSGKYTDWTSWFNTFTTLIGTDAELDDLSKLMHLRSALGAVPLGVIDCLELSGVNYHRSLRLLQDRYENKAIIAQSHINELFSLKSLKQADSEAIRVLVDGVNSKLVALKSLGSDQEIFEALVFHLIRSKLDDETLDKWESEWDNTKLASWPLLSQFLVNRILNLANREARRNNSSRSSTQTVSKKASLAAAGSSTNASSCYCCNGPHGLKTCPKFKELTPLQRYQEVKKRALCLMCFSKRHITRSCDSQRCTTCNKPHHDLLHRNVAEGVGNGMHNGQTQQGSNSLHSSLLAKPSVSLLATAVVLIKGQDGSYHSCRCVLDSGSQVNFLTSKIVSELDLEMRASSMQLSGIGNATSRIVGEVNATFKSRVTRFAATDNFCVLTEITQYNPTSSALGLNWKPPKGVTLADPTFDSSQRIDMLLGISLFFKLIVAGQIKLGPNMPTLQKSLLGWVVVGEFTPRNSVSLLAKEKEQNVLNSNELQELVQRFWRCEEIPQPIDKFTEEEKQCENSFTSNVNTIAELMELKQQVTELLELGRFRLHKWRSNWYKALSIAYESEPLMLKTEDAAKALGIYWMSQSDQFQFAFNVKCGTTITKRTVLSELAQVFDPLGFLSPMLILGKIFVQELWLLKHNWDEELPPSYAKQWQRYREELKLIEQCSLPRSVVPISFEVDTLELFGFSDASNRAYGGAIYARVRNKDGSISVRLVTAKSKVAPVRVTSLPRLELQGALLMARYFTDSTIVLSWLSSHASRWTTFVANRVAEIQESTNIRDWFKVESKLNPADIVSRGLYPNDLSNSTLWWHGPEFLRKPEDDWADTQWRCNLETVPEKRKGTFSLTVSCLGIKDASDIIGDSVTQVEAVMNSRPLHPLSADPNDLEALTPGHFLVGRPLNSLVEPWDEALVKLSLTNHWKRILVVHNMFWRRWKTEYLTLMQERAKWKIAASNIQLGTLALIAEDNASPGQWLLGRVSELHAGSDGAVRVVTLKTKTGFLKRNVHRICPLPLESAIDCFGRSFQGGEYVRATI
ncbi:hypothetical protein ACLKA6_017506 [Drosophila palustris]